MSDSRFYAVPADLKRLLPMKRGMLIDSESHQVIRPATAKDVASFQEKGFVQVARSRHGAFVRPDLDAPAACHDGADEEGL